MTFPRDPSYRARARIGPRKRPFVDLALLKDPIDLSRLDDPRWDHTQPVKDWEYLEPSNVYEPTAADLARRRRPSRRGLVSDSIVATTLVAALAGVLVYGSTAVDAILAAPLATAGPPAIAGVVPTDKPTPPQTAAPSAATTAAPVRSKVEVEVLDGPAKSVFASQATTKMCAPAAVQMTVQILNGTTDTSDDLQREIRDLVEDATYPSDSLNGGAGPDGMASVISDLTGVTYEVRSSDSRSGATRDAAATLSRTGQPVVLLVWRGAHAWVMTGYHADADPTVFDDATVTAISVLDPWYPRISSIWGSSDKPGTDQDADEMTRNFLAWERPEGRYPARDGLFIYLAPVEDE